MNGAEHYHRAEELLRRADHAALRGRDRLEVMAQAQVHATLALADATAMAATEAAQRADRERA